MQPGNPFQIVENVTSQRKTHTQLTITKDQRLYGKDSYVGTSRYFKTTFSDVARLFAKEYDSALVESMKLDRFVLSDLVEDDRGLIAYQTFSIDKKALKEDVDAQTTYFSEEFVAMVLAYGK